MASRFASVIREEITQIKDEADPKNTKKATKFGFAVFKGDGLSFQARERFCLQMQINLA